MPLSGHAPKSESESEIWVWAKNTLVKAFLHLSCQNFVVFWNFNLRPFENYLSDLNTVYKVDRYILLESKYEISLHSDNFR